MTLRIEHCRLEGRFELKGLHLREGDEAECRAWGSTAEELIEHSIRASTASFAVYAYDSEAGKGATPCALWGYGSMSLFSDTCEAWLLTFPSIEEHRVRFMRISRKIIQFLLEMFAAVDIMVDPAYEASVSWLKWLGFTYHSDLIAPTGYVFHTMRRTR